MGESNSVVSAYTWYRHLQQYCSYSSIFFIIFFALSICLSKKYFKTGHNFLIVSDRAFMYNMCIPCGKIFFMVPRSAVEVKLKYRGHIKKCRYGCMGVSQTQFVPPQPRRSFKKKKARLNGRSRSFYGHRHKTVSQEITNFPY